MTNARLTRTPSQPPAPVRIVHLGLGNFFRAHQAWYTANAADADRWGIAAFTGRRPDAAWALSPQDGLYTLITRTPDGDELQVVDSISAVHTASDHESWLDYFRDPEVTIVTITVTEAGYFFDGRGLADDPAVTTDLDALLADPLATMRTTPGKITAGLLARFAADAGPITILPCDNLPDNGEVTKRIVTEFAGRVDEGLVTWMEANVDFASSMVDRITPAGVPEDVAAVAQELGVEDVAPVRTEPFSEWVISGAFPAGHPDWVSAGAQIVDDVLPYEQRKLLLLNGAHSLLAYAATAVGHDTVDAAITDPTCRRWVEELWDDASASVPLPPEEVTEYREALIERFSNPRMADVLSRIAMDGSQKIPVRILPAITTELAAGRIPRGALRAVAAWIAHLRGVGAPFNDARGQDWRETASGDVSDAVRRVAERLGIGTDPAVLETLESELEVLGRG